MGKRADNFMGEFIDCGNVKRRIIVDDVFDNRLRFVLIVANDNFVSPAMSFMKSSAFSLGISFENSCSEETIRVFISSTALLVKVMASIFL